MVKSSQIKNQNQLPKLFAQHRDTRSITSSTEFQRHHQVCILRENIAKRRRHRLRVHHHHHRHVRFHAFVRP